MGEGEDNLSERGKESGMVQHCFYNSPFGRRTTRIDEEGFGDCRVCVADPLNNPLCRGYSPVKVGYINVKE